MPCRSVVAPIAWKDRYKVGVAAIDQDHEQLIRIYNEIVLNMQKPSGGKLNQATLNLLAEYAVNHFKVEEDMMLAMNYPGYSDHKSAHQLFYDYMEDLGVALANGDDENSDFIEFLGDWILSHVLGMDLRISDYLRVRNASKP
jgi:hemerythrin-like metal-binding protein